MLAEQQLPMMYLGTHCGVMVAEYLCIALQLLGEGCCVEASQGLRAWKCVEGGLWGRC